MHWFVQIMAAGLNKILGHDPVKIYHLLNQSQMDGYESSVVASLKMSMQSNSNYIHPYLTLSDFSSHSSLN